MDEGRSDRPRRTATTLPRELPRRCLRIRITKIGLFDHQRRNGNVDIGCARQSGHAERDALQAERIGMMRIAGMIRHATAATVVAGRDIRMSARFRRRIRQAGVGHILHAAAERAGIARRNRGREIECRRQHQEQDEQPACPCAAQAASRNDRSEITPRFFSLPHGIDSTVVARRRASTDSV